MRLVDGGRRMGQQVVIIKQSDIIDSDYDHIITLKNQYWEYPYDSQRKWIEDNLSNDDIHMLLFEETCAVAYLSVCHLTCIIDGKKGFACGIGSVCVKDTVKGKGYGRKIIEAANKEIISQKKSGFLLCHSALIPFYKKCGWRECRFGKVMINNKIFEESVMCINCNLDTLNLIEFNKNF